MSNVVNLHGSRNRYEITQDQIMDMGDYAKIRGERRRALVPIKKNRRIPIGPHATFYFESYETMWLQIHEMLYIEKGGEQQIPDELSAYNPLIPKGDELIATLMFEIDDEILRKNILGRLGGVEETVFLKFDDEEIIATAEEDVDRTTADGKASSVQFLHFKFEPGQIEKFRGWNKETMLGIKHKNYPHMTLLQPDTKAALESDFA